MSDFIFLLIKAVLWSPCGVGMVPFIIYFERKFAGFFQSRMGPTYAGPWGALQSVRRHGQAPLQGGPDARSGGQAGVPAGARTSSSCRAS